MTVRESLTEAANLVSARDAEVLLGHVLGRERTWLLAHPEAEVGTAHATVFDAGIARRASGEPLQYITGVQDFFGLALKVTPAVLIPRPETEHLVEVVLDWVNALKRPARVVDVGTGSGAIAMALAANLPDGEIIATDISSAALHVARENAARLELTHKVRFVEGDLLAGLQDLDVVVSNPPYIPEDDVTTMQREVVEHEPHGALFAGQDGLDVYRRLIPAARASLRCGGLLAMEIGFGQLEQVKSLLTGWERVHFIRDYADIPRVVLAERPQAEIPSVPQGLKPIRYAAL